jgi:hypothetical protein
VNDQNLANFRDSIPRVWWSLYTGARDAGFTEPQAFSLTLGWILSQCPYGIRSPEPPYRKPDPEDEDR